jgi:hypothetical protein
MWNDSIISFIEGFFAGVCLETQMNKTETYNQDCQRLGRDSNWHETLTLQSSHNFLMAHKAHSALPQVRMFLLSEYNLKLILINDYFGVTCIRIAL